MDEITIRLTQPDLPERFNSLREWVAFRAMAHERPLKAQAADMDLSVSTLSRKLNPGDGDTQRFNTDDLEAWCRATGDAAAVIEYLAAKFLQPEDARRRVLLERCEHLAGELKRAVLRLDRLGGGSTS